ncbi:sugar transporter [Lacticaseibacillus chiayiensis]|uniref:Sugar transporter n=2 Tax=Lacticaseibacillus chiayiensis TaxID=2100821 RepID=A0ABY6H973_9LACO|nr:sugar transporter [Lacticaseibacillus chiayiensis]QVI35241.1 sugar transporter [Lacticaseibacillus chiayiensis]RXT58221.1 hypothetical protein CHT97_07575 [Lacticaseibacillus chiayiensis]UYN57022.1 sugar transporter [Lacticaseibacillus chiayiensis]
MQTQTMKTIDKNRQALSLQSMRFNRFLGIRYITAVCFFANLWWSVIAGNLWSKWLPVGLMMLAIPVIYEQIKLFGTPTHYLPYTTLYFWCQTGVNIGLSILIVTPLFNQLYPFVRDTNNNRGIVLLILIIGIGLGGWSLHRLHLIKRDKDRFYGRLMAYQETLHK